METTARQTQYTKALLELRKLLLKGEFEANTRLPETAVAERLGISRTPLRQAMDRLVDEGLLVRLDTGRCQVASFSKHDVIDAIEVRGVMEGMAARMAAERGAREESIEQIHGVLLKLDDALYGKSEIDFEQYIPLNSQFHELLVSMCKSNVVIREATRAKRLPLASPSAFLHGQPLLEDFRATLQTAQTQHKAIVDAIENREGTRAESLTREHARLARYNLKYLLDNDPSLVERVPGLALVEP